MYTHNVPQSPCHRPDALPGPGYAYYVRVLLLLLLSSLLVRFYVAVVLLEIN